MSVKDSMLSPEVIEAVAKNADKMRAAITSGDEMAVLGAMGESAAPRFIKFKFILCDVKIKNINAVAEKKKHHK